MLGVVYGTVRTRASYANDGPITARIDNPKIGGMLTNDEFLESIKRA